MAATIANNRWVRETWDFATRLGEKDLSGMFSKRIVIEEGSEELERQDRQKADRDRQKPRIADRLEYWIQASCQLERRQPLTAR